MKVFLIALTSLLIYATPGFAQARFESLIKKNFRVNPLAGSFSSFLNAFATDPELLNVTSEKKTDTSVFFMKGNYNVFNPFNFKVKNVVVIFAENPKELLPAKKKMDSASTYFSYQIIAYTDDNEAYRKLIQKSYKKLARKLKADLPKTEVTDLSGVMNVKEGEITNFSNGLSKIYAATLGWQTLSQSKQLLLTLLIRLQFVDGYLVPFGFFRNVDNEEESDFD